jgi:hypothetical protein
MILALSATTGSASVPAPSRNNGNERDKDYTKQQNHPD